MSHAQREASPKVGYQKKEKAATSAPELNSLPVVVAVTRVAPQFTEEQIVAERELTRQKKTADYERRKQFQKQDHRVSENEQDQPRQTPPQRKSKKSAQGQSPVDGNESPQPQPQIPVQSQPQPQAQQRQDLKPKKNDVQSRSQPQSPAPAKEQRQSVKNIPQNTVQHEQQLRTEADITLAQWSVEDVVGWLNSIGSGSLAKNFTRNHVTGDILPYITFDDLKTEFEINSFGQRVQLYNNMTELLKSYGEKRIDLRRPSKKSQQKTPHHQEAPPPFEPTHNNNANGNYDEESFQEEQPKQHQRKYKRRYKKNFNHGYTQQQNN